MKSGVLLTLRVIIKSFFFNLKLFSLRTAFHFPILLYPNFKIKGIKSKSNKIIIKDNTKRIVFGGAPSLGLPSVSSGGIILGENAKLILNGGIYISQGTSLRIEEGASIEIGKNTYINGNCYLRSNSKITIGNDCLIGWNVLINTTDGHHLFIDGKESLCSRSIVIGNHCWIGNNSCISKGTTMADNCILAQYSLLNKDFDPNHLLGGIPAKIIKNNVTWKK